MPHRSLEKGSSAGFAARVLIFALLALPGCHKEERRPEAWHTCLPVPVLVPDAGRADGAVAVAKDGGADGRADGGGDGGTDGGTDAVIDGGREAGSGRTDSGGTRREAAAEADANPNDTCDSACARLGGERGTGREEIWECLRAFGADGRPIPADVPLSACQGFQCQVAEPSHGSGGSDGSDSPSPSSGASNSPGSVSSSGPDCTDGSSTLSVFEPCREPDAEPDCAQAQSTCDVLCARQDMECTGAIQGGFSAGPYTILNPGAEYFCAPDGDCN